MHDGGRQSSVVSMRRGGAPNMLGECINGGVKTLTVSGVKC